MNEHKMGDPDKVLKKITNPPTMGIVALIVSFLFLLMCIYGIISVSQEPATVVFIILGGILFITFFLIYFFQSRRVKKNIKNVNLDKVRKEIMEGVNDSYSSKTFFTKSYMLSNHYYGFIIDCNDMIWVYKRTLYDPQTLLPRYDLVICPKDGKKYYTDYLDEYIDEIVKRNKTVLVGNNPDNKEKYKEIIKEINK